MHAPSRPVVFVHAFAPPTAGGTPVLLHRLLVPFGSDLAIFTDIARRPSVAARDPLALPARYRYFRRPPYVAERFAAGRLVSAAATVIAATVVGVRAALAARRIGAGWILSAQDGGFSVIAGTVAARIARVPHVVLTFDLWEENAYRPTELMLARVFEGLLLRRATVIVHCEQMADFYRAKHGIRCLIVRTSTERWPEPAPRVRQPPYEILFAGHVYWAQEDALRRLVRAVRGRADVRVTVLGHRGGLPSLVRMGIEPHGVEPSLSGAAYTTRIQAADVLFVGLSFDSRYPHVVRTASPAKLPDYLASGVPVVVHAPRGSHVAEWTRQSDAAVVVDEADDEALSTAIASVLRDREATARRISNGLELAREHHEIGRVREAFFAALEGLL